MTVSSLKLKVNFRAKYEGLGSWLDCEKVLCSLEHLKSIQNSLLVSNKWRKPGLGRKMEYH